MSGGWQSPVEQLEQRRLLTVANANSSMLIQGPDEAEIRIDIRGDASVEVIGAVVDPQTRQPILVDVPATITTANGTVDVLGGFGGLDGIAPISDFTPANQSFHDTTDNVTPLGPTFLSFEAPSADMNWTALASNSRGQTWGLNFVEVQVGDTTVTRLQVGQISNVDGSVTVNDHIDLKLVDTLPPLPSPPSDPTTRIVAIKDGAFNPSNANQYFFLADVQIALGTIAGGAPAVTTVPSLFRYNIATRELVRIPGFFGSDLFGFIETRTDVQAFTIQDDGAALVFGTVPQIQGRGDNTSIVRRTGLFRTSLSQTNSVFDEVVALAIRDAGGDNLTEVATLQSIEIIPGENQLLALTSATSDARLIRFDNLNDTTRVLGTSLGLTLDPDPTGFGRVRGGNLQSLAWNKTLTNGFSPRSRGMLLSTDAETDELVVLDTRQRFAEVSIYRLVVTPRSPTAQVIVSSGDTAFTAGGGDVGGNTLGNHGQAFIGFGTVLEIDRDTFRGDPPVNRLPQTVQPGIIVKGSLGKLLVDGTVIGSIDVAGSLDTFYAGNVLLGDPSGGEGGRRTNNFSVAGDLRNLIVKGDFGYINDSRLSSSPFWQTGNAINIGGIVHHIDLNGINRGSFDIQGLNTVAKITSNLAEIENRVTVPGGANEAAIVLNSFRGGQISNQAFTNNDTAATGQFLATQLNSRRVGGGVTVKGNLQRNTQPGDTTDFYRMALTAGQTVEVRLNAQFQAAFVNMLDQEGRVVLSDFRRRGDALRYTTTAPGVYAFQILPFIEGTSPISYTLSINNAGNIALGGLTVANASTAPAAFWLNNAEASLRVRNQDLGAIVVDGSLDGLLSGPPVTASRGTIRALIGGTGIGTGEDADRALEIDAPRGNVGLVRANSGDIYLNLGAVDGADPLPQRAIGGDFQIVEAPGGDITANLLANRGIGVIRAQSIGTRVRNTPGFFAVNVDRDKDDGFIDLIDASSNIGDIRWGGPAIDVGTNGNARFIRYGGQIFRDALFGGGTPENTVLPRGQGITIRDDSGANVRITPLTANPAIVPIGTTDLRRGTLDITTYPVRSGGSIILKAEVDQGGLLIQSTGSRKAEISSVVTNGVGPRLRNAAVRLPTQGRSVDALSIAPNPTSKNDIIVEGTGDVSIFEIQSSGTIGNLINRTGGELVNVDAPAVGILEADTIGFARPTRGGVAVAGLATIATERYEAPASPNDFANGALDGDDYPFKGLKNAITLGNALSIRSRNALGNIIIGGSVNEILANTDGQFTRAEVEGVAAPVVVAGQLRKINIGEGIAFSGTGQASTAGIYAGGTGSGLASQGGVIGVIEGPLGANILGDIAATRRIEEINLNNGSIVEAQIQIAPALDIGAELNRFPAVVQFDGNINNPQFDLGKINLRGNGGIIGATIAGGNIDQVRVQGFGIFNTSIAGGSTAVVNRIEAGGYGIRGTTIVGGGRVGNVIATTLTGGTASVKDFTPVVRASESGTFNSDLNLSVSPQNDLYRALNSEAGRIAITPDRPKGLPADRRIVTRGVIENVYIAASRELSRLQGFQIRETRNGDISSSSFEMAVNVGNRVGTIEAAESISGLRVVSGGIGKTIAGEDMDNVRLIVSSTVGEVRAGRDIGRRVFIDAGAGGGRITSVRAGRDMLGSMVAGRSIGSIIAARDIASSSRIGTSAGIRSRGDIDLIQAGGDIRENSRIAATGRIGSLVVGDDVSSGTIIRAASYGSQQIGGTVFGDIVIT